MFVSMFLYGCTVRRQSLAIMVTNGLSEVAVAYAVEEIHEDRTCREEQDGGSRRINQQAVFESRVGGWQLRDRGFKGFLTQMFHAEGAHKDDHAPLVRQDR